MPIPFISTTDLEDYLGYVPTADKATIAIDSACDMLRHTVNQKLDYVEDDVVQLDSDGSDVLLLPEMPAYSPASVMDPNAVALVAGTDYYFDEEMGAISTVNRNLKFQKGRKNYTVTYSHGYTDDATGKHPDVILWPSALRILALQVAARIYGMQPAAAAAGVESETIGGYSVSYGSSATGGGSGAEAYTLTDRERNLLEKVVGVGRRR